MHAYARIRYGHCAAVTKDADKVEEFCVQQRLSFAIRTGQESINPMPLQQTLRSIVSLDDYRAPWEMILLILITNEGSAVKPEKCMARQKNIRNDIYSSLHTF